MPECRKCGTTAVRWGKRAGKRPHEPRAFVLLDAEPNPAGIYAIVDDRVVLACDAPADAPKYTPHEAMCDAAGVPRRRLESA